MEDANTFTDNMASNARMRIGDKEVTFGLSTFLLDDEHIALLISELEKKDYIQNIHKDQQINAIKSAYLFSMNVDLVADKCGTINMSETSDNPVNEPDLSYTEWRKMILNMFLPEEHETFNRISDPEYLRKNLKYHNSKSVDCQMMNLEGEFIWVKLIFNRIDTGNDDDFRFLFMVEDIHESHTRLMKDLKKYENLANIDPLTGIPNHGKIENEINSCVDRCHADNIHVSLLMFDIDYFKHVNDTYGHAVGDYVLKTVSELSYQYIETYGGKLGRWGGEEFIGVCENAGIDKITQIAEELRRIISEYKFENVEHITSSFGVVEVKSYETALDAFKRVDGALYRAKNSGRNKVSIG